MRKRVWIVMMVMTMCALLEPMVWSSNIVIDDRDVNGDVAGNGEPPDGSTGTLGDPNDNSVVLTGGHQITGTAFGAKVYGDGENVSGNVVEINDGQVKKDVLGAYINARGTDVTGNEVRVNDVRVGGSIAGTNINGNGTNVTGNVVRVNDGTVEYGIAGTNINGNGTNVTGNVVRVNDGTVEYGIAGANIVGNGTNVTENKVTMTRVTVGNIVVGAWIGGYGHSGRGVIGSEVELRDAQFGFDFDGIARSVHGGSVGRGTVNENVVNIEGDIVSYGDLRICGGICREEDGNNVSRGNRVYISGKIESSGACIIEGGNANVGIAENNKVVIYDTAQIPVNAKICGGVGDISRGNTLEVYIDFEKGLEVDSINNFQVFKFYILKGIKADSTIMSFNHNGFEEGFNIEGVDIMISVPPNGGLNVGERVKMYCEQGFEASSATPIRSVAVEQKSLTLEHLSIFDIEIDESGKNLIARLSSEGLYAREETKSYSEGVGGRMVFINRGLDFVSGTGIREIEGVEGGRIISFGAMSVGGSKYNRGSGVKERGYLGIGGIGKRIEVKGKRIECGLFCEYGRGEYKAHNDFGEGKVSVEAQGDNEYVGGGLLGKMRINEGSGGVIWDVEGSVRVGRVESDYRTRDIRESNEEGGEEVKYDYDGIYMGMHIGCGCSWKIRERGTIKGYIRYSLGMEGVKEVKLSNEERIKFDDVKSERVRVGARGEGEVGRKIKGYIGIGIEDELEGRIRGEVGNNKKIGEVRLGGFSGIGEIGVDMGISERIRVSLSGEGLVGVREGFSGMLKLKCII